jgi:Flp pilus assembly pilin Flp
MELITRTYLRLHEAKAQTMAEYALVVALASVVSVAAWALFGTNLAGTVNSVAGQI